MRSKRKAFLLTFILALAIFTAACPRQTKIEQINADPARFRDKEVAIAGRVTNSYGFLNRGAYELDDGTGRIWVVTTRGVPSQGSQVGAKGRIHTGFSLGGRSFGTILEENDRRSR